MEPVRFQVVEQSGQQVVQEIYRAVVYRFSVSDTDDPEIYAAEPIWRWQQSEAGKFVMEHAITVPVFHKNISFESLDYEYAITAELEKKKYSEFLLRFGKNGNNKS
jgi:hypothetical protein